ncbi:hypothetical protein JK229_20140 [Pantoea dispersa]|nr:SiaB family protein kinase [Pantoea dispersa]MBS0907428.1 hypothetical protein [Pantoea dispersa]MDI9767202.1 SiaB family protein kinase [Pantoea dispersa]
MHPASTGTHLPPDSVALHYTGFFSPQNITAMGEVIKVFLENQQAPLKVRRRLFSSFVEIVQNILRYSQDSRTLSHAEQHFRFGTVTLHVEGDNYVLESSNQVEQAACEQLRDWLDLLRTMSNDEIKQAYRVGLRTESPATSQGANIGLLTLARDVSEPLEYELRPLPASGYATFWLKATIHQD